MCVQGGCINLAGRRCVSEGADWQIQVLPSSSLVMVRVAEHTASPALLAALQVYCPACSEKASTMMSVAVFVTSSKWNTTFLVG